MDINEAAIAERAESLVAMHHDFVADLVAMRKRHKLSQDTVAERMGVTQPTVAEFERHDSNPTLARLRRYALAVDATIRVEVEDDCSRGKDDWTTLRMLEQRLPSRRVGPPSRLGDWSDPKVAALP